MTTKNIDVLGLGYTAVDELLYVDAHPAADTKVPVCRHERQCGGLTMTALVTAARMECRCGYAGTLGNDELSQFVIQRLNEEGIDTEYIRRQADAGPVCSTIIVDQSRQTRTILYELEDALRVDVRWPHEDVIEAARVLLVDDCNCERMIHAAQIASDAKISIVADFESDKDALFPKLLALIDHLILSRGFAQKLTGEKDPAAAAQSLWTPRRQAVVVTCGREGSCFVSNERPRIPCCQPALTVRAVDTTGCGDVFHGAYAAALVHGLNVSAAVRFASVAAGLKATRRGGQVGIPRRSVVEAELAKDSQQHTHT